MPIGDSIQNPHEIPDMIKRLDTVSRVIKDFVEKIDELEIREGLKKPLRSSTENVQDYIFTLHHSLLKSPRVDDNYDWKSKTATFTKDFAELKERLGKTTLVSNQKPVESFEIVKFLTRFQDKMIDLGLLANGIGINK